MIDKLPVMIAILALMWSSRAYPEQDVEEWLSKNWYVTEVIVFQRGPVMENSSTEKLVLLAERRFPFEMRALTPPPDAIGSFYRLDPITRATLEFPTLEIDLEKFSFLEPVEEYVGPALVEEEDEGEPVTRARTPLVIEPKLQLVNPLGRPAPIIEPILEPHPLLEFLDMLGSFERSLDDRSYRWLPENEMLMGRETRRIESRDNLHVLLHGRWMQPVPERNRPEPLLVQNGARVGDTRQLEGTLAVTLGRYLHFQATLWYREPALGQQPLDIPLGEAFFGISSSSRINPAITLPRPAQGYMQLSESRRLRSREIHYLDHPKLGIVVRIDPVAIPEELTSLLQTFEALETLEEADE
ncbi:MAG: CsiV family protein [Gammaproteobacteria bacterium]|nr:CsiV family protein [Gammaproteobacteria bacterium]